jgi:hypothetical protein
MRLLHPVGEDEVVATFLRGELDSERYGEKLRRLVSRDSRDLDVLRRPDATDSDENAYRRALLEEHRAYVSRQGLFFGFPEHVDWHRAALTADEVLEIRYINWDWWLRISDGTRSPREAARRISTGDVAGVTAEEHMAVIAAPHPELIAAATPALSPLVLVEGHVRLTAYALFPERLPGELEILLGVSDEMAGWCQF